MGQCIPVNGRGWGGEVTSQVTHHAFQSHTKFKHFKHNSTYVTHSLVLSLSYTRTTLSYTFCVASKETLEFSTKFHSGFRHFIEIAV